MPETRIEVLVRDKGAGPGFTIREISGGEAYASFRPVRLRDGYEEKVSVSPLDGKRYYVVKAAGSDEYLSLTAKEHYVWSLMDGARSIKDIISAAYFEFGSLDFAAVRALLARLRGAGLVEFEPVSTLRAGPKARRPLAGLIRGMLSKVELRVENADGWVTRLYDRGGHLLVNRYMMVFYAALSCLGIVTAGKYEGVGKFPYHIFFHHPLAAVAMVLLGVIPIAVVHELFHAMACKRYGRKVHAFGFTLWDGFYPTVYTDVSDIALSSRKDRLGVSLAGPLSTIAIASAFFIPALIWQKNEWAVLSYELGRLNLVIGLIAIYPFQLLKMDGYYILVDLLGFPGLRERTFALVGGLPGMLRAGKRLGRPELFMLAYFVLSIVSAAAFVAYFFF